MGHRFKDVLGAGFTANANCRGYAGVNRKAPHVIQLKGRYDIAVDPSPEKAALQSALGLTTTEAENAFALALPFSNASLPQHTLNS